MEIHCQNMVETLDLLKEVHRNKAAAKVAAIAFDPITTRRVAMAFDSDFHFDSDENKTTSLRHAAMNLIDSVAHSHGGGAWPLVLQEVQPDENKKVQQLSCLTLVWLVESSAICLPFL